MQLAVCNRSKADDLDLAFACEAVNHQVIEAAGPWDVPTNVMVFYSTPDGLPQENARIIEIVDDLDVPGALGYHSAKFGLPYGKVLNHPGLSVTLSHEGLEMLVDPFANVWHKRDEFTQVALEVADPVQADTYTVKARLFGEDRDVPVSSYVLPRWFDAGAPGPLDKLGRLSRPFELTPGGFCIVRDWTGEVSHAYGHARVRCADEVGRMSLATKLAAPGSRLAARLR